MAKERDELGRSEDVKTGGLISVLIGAVAVVGAIAKTVSNISDQNQRAEDMRERDNIHRKTFKTREEKARMKEIDNKYKK